MQLEAFFSIFDIVILTYDGVKSGDSVTIK